MSREGIPTWFFAVTVVRDGDRFLLIHERKHRGWYLPAGRAEPGETLMHAAVREALEEAGVHIELEALVRVEHTPARDHARIRAIFLAKPISGSPGATEDSLDARWVTIDEAAALPLRGDDVLMYLRYVANGGALAPLSALALEHDLLPA